MHITNEFVYISSEFILLNSGSKIIDKFYLIVPKQEYYINPKFTSRATKEINKFVRNSRHLEQLNLLDFTYVYSQNSLYISHS